MTALVIRGDARHLPLPDETNDEQWFPTTYGKKLHKPGMADGIYSVCGRYLYRPRIDEHDQKSGIYLRCNRCDALTKDKP